MGRLPRASPDCVVGRGLHAPRRGPAARQPDRSGKPFGEDLESAVELNRLLADTLPVEIVWDESLALEGRAGYDDGVGALKDMVQNPPAPAACLVAMEPPINFGVRDRKVDVLRSVRPFSDHDVTRRTRRGRYLASRIR